MAAGDRDFRLLLAIMARLGESRGTYDWLHTRDLVDLIPANLRNADSGLDTVMLDGYLRFLEQKGYVELGRPTLQDRNRTIRLTADGETLVQPELAQIDDPQIFSRMIEAMEKEILTYPDEAVRHKYLEQFREAAVKHLPDVAVKLFVEILLKKSGI